MKPLLKLLGALIVIIVALVLILPIGIRTGADFISNTPTPQEVQDTNASNGLTADAYVNEAECHYFVRTRIESLAHWRFSDSPEPEMPTCEFLTFYWHDGWLIDPGTVLF